MPARNCARRPLALHNRYMQRGGAADALQPQCLRAGAADPTLRPPPNAREVITLGPRATDSRDTDIRISYLETQGMRVRMCVRVFSVRSTLKSMRDSRDSLYAKFRRFYAAAGWRTRPALACVRGTRAHTGCALPWLSQAQPGRTCALRLEDYACAFTFALPAHAHRSRESRTGTVP